MLWAPFVLIDNKGVNHNILINWHKNLHLHADHHFSCKKLGRKNNTLPHLLRFSSALSLGLVFVAESQSSLEKKISTRRSVACEELEGSGSSLGKQTVVDLDWFFLGLDEILRRFFSIHVRLIFFLNKFSLNVSHSGPFFLFFLLQRENSNYWTIVCQLITRGCPFYTNNYVARA